MKRLQALGFGFFAGLLVAAPASANPTGAQVVHGSATITTPNATTTQITNSPNAVINWQSFSVGSNETTRFVQQSAASAVMNRVVGVDPSQILGNLTSNGQVFLINPNGLVFGAGAVVDTAGFVGSTLNITDADFLAGKLKFQGDAASGSIKNHGLIKSRGDGSIYLVAPDIKNDGIIRTEDGRILLAAGRKLTVSSLDVDFISFEIQAPADQVVNLGELLTSGGSVGLFASRIHNAGRIRASAVSRDANGNIVLQAGAGGLQLGANSEISATSAQDSGASIKVDGGASAEVAGIISADSVAGKGGDIAITADTVSVAAAQLDASGSAGGGRVRIGGEFQGGKGGAVEEVRNASRVRISADTTIKAAARASHGDGGDVVIWSDQITQFGGHIDARPGTESGSGGQVEVSGAEFLYFRGTVESGRGDRFGRVLLDPKNINIAAGGTDEPNNSLFLDSPGADFTIDANTVASLLAGQAVTLQANNDITVSASISTGSGTQQLMLQAGRSIVMNASTSISTFDGDIEFIANETLSFGVVDAQRDAGAGGITMGATSLITTSGKVVMIVEDDPSKTNNTSGNIAIESLSASHVLLEMRGSTDNSSIFTNLGAPGITASSVFIEHFPNSGGQLGNGGPAIGLAGQPLQLNLVDNFAAHTHRDGLINVNFSQPGVTTIGGTFFGQGKAITGVATGTDQDGGDISLVADGTIVVIDDIKAGATGATNIQTGGDLSLVAGAGGLGGAFARVFGDAITLDVGNNLSLTGGTGVNNSASIESSNIAIDVSNGVTLTAGTGTNAGARIGSGSSAANVTLGANTAIGGSVFLSGAAAGGAAIGTGCISGPCDATVVIDAVGGISLVGTLAMVGSLSALNGDSGGSISMSSSIGNVSLNGGALSTPGAVTLSGGNVSQNSASGGINAQSLDILAAGNIALSSITNDVASFSASTTGPGIFVFNNDGTLNALNGLGLTLGNVNLGTGNFTLNTTNGNLTQTGALTSNVADITTGAGTATLTNAGNNFISFNLSSTNTASVVDTGGLALGTVNLGAGNFTLDTTGGALTQTGALTSNVADITTGAGTATLDNTGNNFTSFNLNSINTDATVVDTGGLALGNVNLGTGNFTLNTTNGNLTQTGALTSNVADITTGAGTATLTNAGNNFTSFNLSSTNTASVVDTGGLALGTVNAGTGNFTLDTTGGALTQTGALTSSVAGITTGAGTLTLDNAGNNLTGLALNTSAAASVTDGSGGLDLGASTVGDALTLNIAGQVTQSGSLVSSTSTTFNTSAVDTVLNLAGQANNLTGAVNLAADGGGNYTTVEIRNDSTGAGAIGGLGTAIGNLTLNYTAANIDLATGLNVSNNLTLSSNGSVTQTGNVSVGNVADITAANITLDNTTNNFTSLALNTSGANGDASIVDTGGLALGTVNLGAGNFTLNTTNGNLTQTGALTSNVADITTGAGTATLDNAGNNFTSFNLSSTNADASVVDTSGLALGTVNVGTGNFTLDTTGGALTQTGALTSNVADITTGAGTATLDNAGNNFTSFNLSSTNTASVVDTGGLALGTVNLGAGNFTLNTTGGALTQTGALTSNVADITTGAGTATLTNAGNNFISFNLSSTNADASVVDTSGLALGTVNLGTGNFTLNTTNGNLTQTGALTSNVADITTGAGTATLTNAGNNFTSLDLSATNTDASVADTGGLALGTVNVGTGDFTLNTSNGTLTQTGALTTNVANITTGAGNLTLDNAGNNLTTAVLSTTNNATLVEANGLNLGASTVGGTLGLTVASGDLNISAPSSVGAADFNIATGNYSGGANQLDVGAGNSTITAKQFNGTDINVNVSGSLTLAQQAGDTIGLGNAAGGTVKFSNAALAGITGLGSLTIGNGGDSIVLGQNTTLSALPQTILSAGSITADGAATTTNVTNNVVFNTTSLNVNTNGNLTVAGTAAFNSVANVTANILNVTGQTSFSGTTLIEASRVLLTSTAGTGTLSLLPNASVNTTLGGVGQFIDATTLGALGGFNGDLRLGTNLDVSNGAAQATPVNRFSNVTFSNVGALNMTGVDSIATVVSLGDITFNNLASVTAIKGVNLIALGETAGTTGSLAQLGINTIINVNGTGGTAVVLATGNIGAAPGQVLNIAVPNGTLELAATNVEDVVLAASTQASTGAILAGNAAPNVGIAAQAIALNQASFNAAGAALLTTTVSRVQLVSRAAATAGVAATSNNTEVEEEDNLSTSGLESLTQISLVDIEIGVLTPWYVRDDVPPADATQAEWDAFIAAVLADYPDEEKAEIQAEIEAYRASALASLELEGVGVEEDGTGDGTGGDGTGDDGTGSDGTGGDSSTDTTPAADNAALEQSGKGFSRVLPAAREWNAGGVGFETRYWQTSV